MSAIPDDIRKKAHSIADYWADGGFSKDLEADIARALMERDERAVRICDKQAIESREEATAFGNAKKYTTANHWNAHATGCEDCAIAIRSPNTTEKP